MRRYAWVTAVCLAALMASGCGNQTGQETKQNSVSVSESAASGEPEENQMMWDRMEMR